MFVLYGMLMLEQVHKKASKMVNAYSEVDGIGNVEHFIEGFQLAAKIIIDVMRENDGVLRDIVD